MGELLAIDIVADDDAMRQSLRALLESYGFAVRDHLTGAAFLETHASRNSRCLLLDAHRPAPEGLDIVTRLRRDIRSAVPVVMITGSGNGRFKKQAIAAGATALLEMPFESETLFETVKCLGGRGGAPHQCRQENA